MTFPYKVRFREALAGLRREGRYRVFADIVRRRGAYPEADLHSEARIAADHRLVQQRLSRHEPASQSAGGDA